MTEQYAMSIENMQDALMENNAKMKNWVLSQLNNFSTVNIKWIKNGELPTENISTTTIYMVKDSTSTKKNNIYDEYIYNEETGWELLGKANLNDINLNNYYDKEEIDIKINEILNHNSYTDEEVTKAIKQILS